MRRLSDSLRLQLVGLLDSGSSVQSLIPSPVVLVSLDLIHAIGKEDLLNDRLPGDECEVGVRGLVPDQVLLALEDVVQDANDTHCMRWSARTLAASLMKTRPIDSCENGRILTGLLLVALERAGHLFLVEDLKPGPLTIVRALARHLEVEELLFEELLG